MDLNPTHYSVNLFGFLMVVLPMAIAICLLALAIIELKLEVSAIRKSQPPSPSGQQP